MSVFQLFVDAIVDEFKYLGSYMGSTDKDIRNRIALAWAAFAKLRPILASSSGKQSVKMKMRLFDAACISILLYGCESWILTASQLNKLDVFVRTCYRIMFEIRQSESHMTNKKYEKASARPISATIRERQLQFTGHCLRMPTDEPANMYVLYSSNVADTHRRGRGRQTYTDQVSAYLCRDKKIGFCAAEIAAYAKDKSTWRKLVSAPYQPDR